MVMGLFRSVFCRSLIKKNEVSDARFRFKISAGLEKMTVRDDDVVSLFHVWSLEFHRKLQ